jgi:hypothetical protein
VRWLCAGVVLVFWLTAACSTGSNPDAQPGVSASPSPKSESTGVGTDTEGDTIFETDEEGGSPTLASPADVAIKGAVLRYGGLSGPGVATRVELLGTEFGDRWNSADVERIDRDVPLAFALRRCDVVGNQLVHEVQWRPPAGLELPVTVTMFVGPADFWWQFGSVGYEVDLAAPGVFRFDVDLAEIAPDQMSDGASVIAGQTGRADLCSMVVYSERYIDVQTEPGLTYGSAPQGPTVDAPSESIQALATSDLPTAGPMLELLISLGPDTEVLPDRWWLAPEAEPERLEVGREHGCWKVVSNWTDPAVRVQQSRGCPSDHFADLTTKIVQIEDDAWDVVVIGSAAEVDRFLEMVRPLSVAGVDPVAAEGREFDAVATARSQAKERGLSVLAELPWGDSGVIIVTVGNEPGLHDFEAEGFNPNPFNAGATGRPLQRGVCIGTFLSTNTQTGFAIAYFEDPEIAGIEVQREDGRWAPVEVVENRGVSVGVLDDDLVQQGPIGVDAPEVRGFTADGELFVCTS